MQLIDSKYARVDSNHWPLVPETNALSGLSYGRVLWILAVTPARVEGKTSTVPVETLTQSSGEPSIWDVPYHLAKAYEASYQIDGAPIESSSRLLGFGSRVRTGEVPPVFDVLQ